MTGFPSRSTLVLGRSSSGWLIAGPRPILRPGAGRLIEVPAQASSCYVELTAHRTLHSHLMLPIIKVWPVRHSSHPLAQDRPQHPPAVAKRPEVALPVDAVSLEAGNLADVEAGTCDPDVDERLHLEARTVDVHRSQAVPPEGVVAVAEVGVGSSKQEVDDTVEPTVADLAQPGYVRAPPPSRKRVPFAKSAPAINVSTKAGISAGSAD